MIRIIIAAVIIFLFYYFGIDIFRKLTRREKWNLTKLLTYSAFCSILTLITVTLFVQIF